MTFFRVVFVFVFFIFVSDLGYSQELKPIKLWKTHFDSGKTFLETLNKRSSKEYSYSSRELSMQLLSDLFWAANGISRAETGRKTTPSILANDAIDIYVTMEKGVFIYDPIKHVLNPTIKNDLRWLTGKRDYVKSVPINILYIVDYERMSGITENRREMVAAAGAGSMAQNVNLFCAAFDLITALRAKIEREKLSQELQLKPSQFILFAQSVGYSNFSR